MRDLGIAGFLALALGLAAPTYAETVAVSQMVTVRAKGAATVQLICPEGLEISSEVQVHTSRWPSGIDRTDLHFLDRKRNLAALEDAEGQEATLRNTLATDADVSAVMLCAKRESPPVLSNVTLNPIGVGLMLGICPSGTAPAGSATDIDGSAVRTTYKLFKYGNKYLDEMPDGNSTGAPDGIEVYATNTIQYVQPLRMATRCVPAGGLETLVQSVPTTPGATYSMYFPIPDGYEFVGMTGAPGNNGAFTLLHLWLADGTVSSLMSPGADPGGHAGAVKGLFIDGIDTRSAGAKFSDRAYVGVLVRRTGTAVPPPTVVSVVEFYNAALDHYFITANAKEIADLDGGVHKGWARTGKSFTAWGVGSSGNSGRRPVCRAYGNPAAGLDSHFYSASPQECVATVTRFNGAWLLEAAEVFEMELPDTKTGACTSGGAPIYRVWNNRSDSNHRYTTSIADRDAMVAKGYVKEGYGPNSVTLCAVP
ncbi:MAG: hypothetical protein U1F54_03765 [Burkholderiales bacterium]